MDNQNPKRPTPTRQLVLAGVVIGGVVAVAAFALGADSGTGQRFNGLFQASLGLAMLIGGGWSALRRKKH